MESNKTQFHKKDKTTQDDILFHLAEILIDLTRIKLDYNRNSAIVYKMNNLSEKINLIIELYKTNDSQKYRALKNYLNRLIVEDPNLKGIILHIENTRCHNAKGSVKMAKIEI